MVINPVRASLLCPTHACVSPLLAVTRVTNSLGYVALDISRLRKRLRLEALVSVAMHEACLLHVSPSDQTAPSSSHIQL